MKYILIIIFSFIFQNLLTGQFLSGTIIDKETNDPIAGARIRVTETRVLGITDEAGRFSIEAKAGQNLMIEHPFYRSVIVEAREEQKYYLETSVINLEAITVEADPLKDITHSFVVMDDIKKGSQPRSSADLFADIPGFSIHRRSTVASEPSLRSFKYDQMNIIIDGFTRLVCACPNRMDPITAHIIPEEVNRMEVVRGPYTVRFGQTFGGIVNIITKQPQPADYGFGGSVEGAYETNGNNIVSRAEIMYARKKFDLTMNGEYRDFGNYRDRNGLDVPSSFNTISYSIKTGINPAKNQRLQFDWRQKFGQDIMHAGLPMDSPKDNSYAATLDYKIRNINPVFNSITLKSYYTVVDHLMNNYLRPNFVRMDASTPVMSNTYGAKIELGLTPVSGMNIFAGIDANADSRSGERTRIGKMKPDGTPIPVDKRPVFIDSVWQDAFVNNIGIFCESSFEIGKNLIATAGIRTDFVSAGAESPATGFYSKYESGFENRSENVVGGNISVKYLFENAKIQIAYGLGARSASILERYIYHFAIGIDGYEYVGNPFLSPEKNHQFELSAAYSHRRFSAGASVFYSHIPDYISAVYKDGDENFRSVFANPNPYAKQFINVDAEQYGFETYFNFEILPGLDFNSSLAYTRAENKTFGEPLPQIAPLAARFALKYEKSRYWAEIRSFIAAKQDRLATSFGETVPTPGYNTMDLKLGFRPIEGLSIGLAVSNIFDTAYYNHLTFKYANTLPELVGKNILDPGRNFSLYGKYSF
jgi:iron complex outermembrane receptor protein